MTIVVSFFIPYVNVLHSCLLGFSVFGFAAALLESIPIVGLIFTISNRVDAAMWAHGTSLSHP